MSDDDFYRFLARLPAEKYTRLRNFLQSGREQSNEKPNNGEVDVASRQIKNLCQRHKKDKKPRV